MVNTCNRQQNLPEGQIEDELTADQPALIATTEGAPATNVLGGGPEQIPRTNMASTNPIMEEVTMETRIRDSMMHSMNSAMTQQQKFFMKLLEDRDASHRQPETMDENIVNGSGGGPTVVVTEEQLGNESKGKVKGYTYKAFLGCNPKEFSGSTNPVACM
ncbi:hypothetical protein L6452_21530 [Arctium lappa]|uniref:Uncharacterized protein n=1 Tax=Arctium lappa TaxID=4217 RepID=A0ACB9AWV4_ARCLA|nr:hypothetical protein L6452_21530 [Arctium lappa]